MGESRPSLDEIFGGGSSSGSATAIASGGRPSLSDIFDGTNPTALDKAQKEEEFGGPTGAIAGFVSNAVNTALPGVGPKFQKAIGISPETQKGLAEANPISSFLGGAGAIASGAGVAGVIGKAGGIAGALAESPIASAALKYGTEGALYGAGSAANDYALGDPNLNAQKIASYVGMGGLLGAAGGGGLATLAKGAETVLPKAVEKLSSSIDSLKELAIGTPEEPSLAVKAAAGPGSVMSGSTPQDWAQSFVRSAYGENQDAFIQKMAPNLDKILSNAKLVAGKEAPEFLSDFEDEFTGKSGAVDPDKLKPLFSGSLSPEIAGKEQTLNGFMNGVSTLAQESKNSAAYEGTMATVSDEILKLAKQHEELSEVASALKSQGKKGPASMGFLKDIGAFGLLKSAGLSGPLATGLTAAFDVAQRLDNPAQAGELVANTLSKFTAIAKIVEKVGKEISANSKAIFSGPVSAISAPINNVLTGPKSYEKRTERVMELAMNPETLINHMANNTVGISDVAPSVTQGVNATMTGAVQFLHSKIPTPLNQMPLNQEWEPTPQQRSRFERYYNAVNDPISALKDVKNGSLNNETMEALAAVHPHLLQEMREKVTENMHVAKARNLSYATKISLSKFMGQPLDSQMLPGAIQANQMALQAPSMSQDASPHQRGKRTSVAGLKQLSFAQRSATETQDLETDES